MSRFRDEVSIISPTGRMVAVLVWIAVTLLLGALFTFVAKPGDPPLAVRLIMMLFVPLPLTAWALVIAYINADARRRGMPYILWTLLAIFVPSALGVVLYFILREPLLVSCPSCGHNLRGSYVFCPFCGAGVGRTCAGCRRQVEAGWAVCAYCGQRLDHG